MSPFLNVLQNAQADGVVLQGGEDPKGGKLSQDYGTEWTVMDGTGYDGMRNDGMDDGIRWDGMIYDTLHSISSSANRMELDWDGIG